MPDAPLPQAHAGAGTGLRQDVRAGPFEAGLHRRRHNPEIPGKFPVNAPRFYERRIDEPLIDERPRPMEWYRRGLIEDILLFGGSASRRPLSTAKYCRGLIEVHDRIDGGRMPPLLSAASVTAASLKIY
ncbi:MAG: hypothetical protein GVY13_06090 [Alphaproteobacteria bacterium]|nr:hypothetical protein [Alphaproteobacteria bacterium]